MDPTYTLDQIRNGISAYVTKDDRWYDGYWPDVMIEHVIDLDTWMSAGGPLPSQWVAEPKQGRPRRTQDGTVLDDVVHGKRTAYNRGCRCMECTEANRAAGARRRANKRQGENA